MGDARAGIRARVPSCHISQGNHMTTQAAAAAPVKECDLVMKGGVTSGIVYPPVVQTLQPTYRFRSIGGTSAGDIAAAIVAASEFDLKTKDAGVARLEALQET